MVALLLGRWKILAALRTDVAEMPGPAMPAVDWQAQEDARLPALLSRDTCVSEGQVEPLEVLLKSVLISPLCRLASSLLMKNILQRPHTKTPDLNSALHHC